MSYSNTVVGNYRDRVKSDLAVFSAGGTLLVWIFEVTSKQYAKVLNSAIEYSDLNLYGGSTGSKYLTSKGESFSKGYSPQYDQGRPVYLGIAVNNAIKDRYIITTDEDEDQDMYNFLMSHFHLQLLPEWIPVIRDRLTREGYLRRTASWNTTWQFTSPETIKEKMESVMAERKAAAEKAGKKVGSAFSNMNCDEEGNLFIKLHGKQVPLNKLKVHDMGLINQMALERVVCELGCEGKIAIAKKLSKYFKYTELQPYITKYGPALALSILQDMESLLTEEQALDPDGLVLMDTSLIPQQVRCVNGVMALMKHHKRFAFLLETMGLGKTPQTLAAIYGNECRKVMARYGDSSIAEMFANGHLPMFRAIIMCPGHLCMKWVEQIKQEIPFSTAKVIGDYSDLIAIQEKGPERTGAEFYVISKDFAKLDAAWTPIPSTVGRLPVQRVICRPCYESSGRVIFKPNTQRAKCRCCGGSDWMTQDMTSVGRQYGLICPSCGNVLIKYSSKYVTEDRVSDLTLRPADFATRKDSNERCYICGAELWGVDAKNIGGESQAHKKWKKISYYRNFQMKGRSSGFVLKGHDGEFFASLKNGIRKDAKDLDPTGPRKSSPAQYIKKHLKGFFDYSVLDEAHKYSGAGTAQGVAAQALVKASKFTLALTGTVSNGKADSLFYLFWTLCPRQMVARKYDYKSVLKFCKDYGSVQTKFESKGANDEDYGAHNTNSRGRQLGTPRIKPGISPLVQPEFLVSQSVFLDTSDVETALPPLVEKVVSVKLPDKVQNAYDSYMRILREECSKPHGMRYMATMLQSSLAIASKPWGQEPVMKADEEGELLAQFTNFPEYESLDNLLPKEEAFLETVQKELDEGRNMFVYCNYTGGGAYDVTERLKALIERYCNLEGQVMILRSNDCKAIDREQYIHKAAARGIRVIICNMKLVEVGLDFCFKHNGVKYNYPSILVYQVSYELAVMMQSTRRHYRLNQTEECRTYYFVTEGTAESAALTLMADKMTAASALQGNFSVEGLAAMASGVDDRVKLIRMMQSGDMGDSRAAIEAKFAKIQHAQAKAKSAQELFNQQGRSRTYHEIVGELGIAAAEQAEAAMEEVKKIVTKTKETPAPVVDTTAVEISEGAFTIFDFMKDIEMPAAPAVMPAEKPKKKKTKKTVDGQLSLFDLLGA